MKQMIFISALCMLAALTISCSKEPEKKTVLQSGTAAAGDAGYDHRLTVDKINFNWKIAGPVLMVKLSAPTAGWVGIGFNATEGMKDAHFIMGYVKDGAVKVSDQHGVSKNLHKDNVLLGGTSTVGKAAGSEKNGVTELTFSVPLESKDKLDGRIKTGEDIVVLLACGKSDLLGQQHSFRSRMSLNLTTGKFAVTDMASK